MTQPRALFKPEERDNILYSASMEIREVHAKLDDLINAVGDYRKCTDSRIAIIDERRAKDIRDIWKGLGGLSLVVIAALMGGLLV